MMFSYECSVISHIGNRRKNNEDNFFVGENCVLTPDEQRSMSQVENRVIHKQTQFDGSINRICAISDGMGGHKNGEVASRMVIEALMSFSKQHQRRASLKRRDKFEFIQSFQEMIFQTNGIILDCSGGDFELDTMGATLTGILLFPDEAVPFNIGDSSTFLYEEDSLRKLTIDDNEAEQFREANIELNENNGKRLTKYFGMPRSCGTLTARASPPIPLNIGQIFIIASDGLTDYCSQEEIAQAIAKCGFAPDLISEQLVEMALCKENGGRDNITVAVIKVNLKGAGENDRK